MTDQERHILLKAIRNESLSPDEEAVLQNWLAADPDHATQLGDARWNWAEAATLLEAPKGDVDAAWSRLHTEMESAPNEEPRRPNRQWRWWAAAVAILLMVVGKMWWDGRNAGPAWKMVAESGETARSLQLADGSAVTLYPASTLWAEPDFGGTERRLRLRGQAFFEVTEDARRPFTVDAGDYGVTVLGTEFYLNATDSTAPTLDVLDGRVAFYPLTEPTRGDTLLAFESASINGQGSISRDPQTDFLRILPVSNQDFSFEDLPLSEVFSRLVRLYRVPIRVNNPGLEACKFTGRFKGASLDDVLQSLEATFGPDFSYGVETGGVVVDGPTCTP